MFQNTGATGERGTFQTNFREVLITLSEKAIVPLTGLVDSETEPPGVTYWRHLERIMCTGLNLDPLTLEKAQQQVIKVSLYHATAINPLFLRCKSLADQLWPRIRPYICLFCYIYHAARRRHNYCRKHWTASRSLPLFCSRSPTPPQSA